MSDISMSPRSVKQFWENVQELSISILPSVYIYRVTETSKIFLQILDDFNLQKHHVEHFIWMQTSKQKLRTVLKLVNGTFMYLKMRNTFENGPTSIVYLSSSLDLLERRMSNKTFDAYRTRRKH